MGTKGSGDQEEEILQDNVYTDLLSGTGRGGLTSAGYFEDCALRSRIEDDESVKFALTNKRSGIKIRWASETQEITPDRGYRSALLLTDKRILAVIGKAVGDRAFDVPLRKILSADSSSGILRNSIRIDTTEAKFEFSTRRHDPVEVAASWLQEQIQSLNSEKDPEGTADSVEESEPERSEASTGDGQSSSATGISSRSSENTGTEKAILDGWNFPSVSEHPELPPDVVSRLDNIRKFVENPEPDVAGYGELVTVHQALCGLIDSSDGISDELRNQFESSIEAVETELDSRQEGRSNISQSKDDRDPGPSGSEPETLPTDEGSQRSSIEITVSHLTGDPIPGANITLNLRDSQLSGVTDENGSCVFSIIQDQVIENAELRVACEGFSPESRYVNLETVQKLQVSLSEEEIDSDTGVSDREAVSGEDTGQDAPADPTSSDDAASGLEDASGSTSEGEFTQSETARWRTKGRVDEVTVTVVAIEENPGSKRDLRLRVRTDDDEILPLNIWSTHSIDYEFREGVKYCLREARHKQWNAQDGIEHELSSTSDLEIVQLETDESDFSGADGDESAVEGDSSTTETEDSNSEKGGIVEDILKDMF